MIGFDDEELDDLNIPRLRVSLRIRGDALDPDFLTQQLGVAPSFCARKGDLIARRGTERLQTTGVWTYRLEVPASTELGDAVARLMAVLPEDATLWEEITSSFTADVFCDVRLQNDNQSTLIQPEVLRTVGRRGLPLTFDLFR